MLIVKKEPVPLYGGKRSVLHVVVVDEKGYPEMIDHIDKNDKFSNTPEEWPPFEKFAGLAYERTTRKGVTDWWVIFAIHPDKLNNKISIETICHEALHITRMILTDRGVIFDPHNDEPYAYLIGKIADMMNKMLPAKYKKL